jgi:hypothetical protein
MVQVTHQDLEYLNELTAAGDKARAELTSTMLTIYAALSSGLFLLLSNGTFKVSTLNGASKVALLITTLSATSIVLVSAIEKIADHAAQVQVGKEFAKRVRNGASNVKKPLKPGKYTTLYLIVAPILLLCLIVINAISASVYITMLILK